MDIKTHQFDRMIASNKTPESLHVYSGVPYDPRTKMNSEGIVHHPAYIASSLKKSVAKGFADKHASYEKEVAAHEEHIEF